ALLNQGYRHRWMMEEEGGKEAGGDEQYIQSFVVFKILRGRYTQQFKRFVFKMKSKITIAREERYTKPLVVVYN
ncbi:hypothetical protein ACJX0J_009348, partial [Zea mays]